MVGNILRRVIGSRNERLLRRYRRAVAAVNELEPDLRNRDDAGLARVTETLRGRRAAGEPVEALIPEAFAVVREAGRRSLEMRHFDVQLIGGVVLHEGRIAEMRTGEGKTLVATLAAYLNALGGDCVHIVTVNDYLARRDADWMGHIYRLLGMTVGVVVPGQTPGEKREAYRADIVYGTNNEFGFDYLRDNMAFSFVEKVQPRLAYAIVDEVDSILIDEARTPLIISGPSEESSELYLRINRLIPKLERQEREPADEEDQVPGDYFVDEKTRQAHLTETGYRRVEELLGDEGLLGRGESLYDTANVMLLHHFDAALRAHSLYHRDVHYLVRGGEVVIVDEFTGRTMAGRRWSDGLHQAVEAKEGVTIRQENQTLASITFQNYFRLYGKLAGMTGTADTEAAEFQQIYGLEVAVIPTHLAMIRDDRADLVYLKQEEKFQAIVDEIGECRERGQPVLVGTASIETSEFLSSRLRREDIPHQVLNAKHHEREAQIIAQAGKPGTVTIATNMAGRGTDIVLGGNWRVEYGEEADEEVRMAWQERHDAVVKAGGLHIVGTERHESRRIDNQLRGRSGRQGDPGSSRFFLSLEDDLMRIFAAERVSGLMQKLGVEEGEAIEHRWVTRAIENAQRKVEGRNFDIRKQLLEYDDVANDQRREIYALRDELMSTDDVSEMCRTIRADVVNATIDGFIPPESLDELWGRAGTRAGACRRVRPLARPPGLARRRRRTPRGAPARAHTRRVRGRPPRQGEGGRAGNDAGDREGGDAPGAGRDLEGAPRRDGLPPPGDPPSRVRAEESQAGVQARVVRDVPRPAGAVQDRGDEAPFPRGDPARRRAGAPPCPAAAPARAGGVLARGGERTRARGGDGRRHRGNRGGGVDPRVTRGVRPAVRPGGQEGRTQRALSLRLGKEVQALPRAPALVSCHSSNVG